MKTIVLDDDPTGTQSASNVTVLLHSDADLLAAALTDADSVYVQTNSRALDEDAAITLVRRIRDDGLAAASRLGETVRFVLRGDSTLRGHVFAETAQFVSDDAVVVFVPAFPDGGRTTVDGVHLVRLGDTDVPAHETEYADDPVFGFSHGRLTEYIREKTTWEPVAVDIATVRDGGLTELLATASAGSAILPDAHDNTDIHRIAEAVEAAGLEGREIVVRCASPLAAALAGVTSDGLLQDALDDGTGTVLLVCGSHTAGATAQLERIADAYGTPVTIDTGRALEEPRDAADDVTARARKDIAARGVALIGSDRHRRPEHNTLRHGEHVMAALTTVVADVLSDVDIVVAKGGITSADVARIGMGARAALVLGQVLPGVSVWRMECRDGRERLYVVVPGNVGGPDTLRDVLTALGR